MSKAKAAQACVDRFAGKAYEPGKRRDCGRLVLHHLHHLGIKVPFVKGCNWGTEAGAYRALRKMGFEQLSAAVDAAGFPRIAPARALVGDIVALPASNPAWDCVLTVALGNGRVLAFVDGRCRAVQPKQYVTAWRV